MTDVVPHRRTVAPDTPLGEEITRLVAVVGARLQAREAELNTTMNQAIEEAIDDLDRPETLETLHASVGANIATIVHMLRHDVPLSDVPGIPAATEYAITLAQNGVSAVSLRRAYHFGSDDLLAQIFHEVQQLDIDADLRLRLLHHLAGWTHSYVDWITRSVLEAYEDERRQIDERSASIAASLVRSVLTSSHAPERFSERTGYRLDQFHVGAVLWVAGGNPGVDHHDRLLRAARRIVEHVGATRSLVTAVDRSSSWLWIGRGVEEREVLAPTAAVAVADDPDIRVALGAPSRGVDGFRRTHAEANTVRGLLALAQTREQAMSYADRAVALVAMLGHDLDALRAWVRGALGPVAENSEAAARTRETLLAYYAGGDSYQAAAESLVVHRNTVKYRVARAREQMGERRSADRLSIEVALETARLLGGAVLAAPTPPG